MNDEPMQAGEQVHVGVLATWRKAAKCAREVQEIVALSVEEEINENENEQGRGPSHKGSRAMGRMPRQRRSSRRVAAPEVPSPILEVDDRVGVFVEELL